MRIARTGLVTLCLGSLFLSGMARTARADDKAKPPARNQALKPQQPSAPQPQALPQAQPQAQQKKAEVLDFDADVIEGQKKTPELFLQTEVDRPSLEAILYQRRDFNDFHAVDSRQRPRFSDAPKGGKQ